MTEKRLTDKIVLGSILQKSNVCSWSGRNGLKRFVSDRQRRLCIQSWNPNACNETCRNGCKMTEMCQTVKRVLPGLFDFKMFDHKYQTWVHPISSLKTQKCLTGCVLVLYEMFFQCLQSLTINTPPIITRAVCNQTIFTSSK